MCAISNDDLHAILVRLSAQMDALSLKIDTLAPPAPKPAGAKPLQIALVGGGLHGAKSLKALLALKDCQITYICDVDSAKGAARVKEVKAARGNTPKYVSDFRVALADPAVAAVVIVTPHHWHALATVLALRAGKHVYVEKPVTHSFNEGPVLLAAAKKYRKVVMPGTQLRSNSSLMAAGEYMRAGKLGDITLVHCIIHKDRPALPPHTDTPVPETVNYDMWLGPRPDLPLTRTKFHYHWHWFWEFGNGALGNNGIHRIDAARMALQLPPRADLTLSIGGRFGPADMSETPNTQLCLYRFGDTWVLQDVLGVKPKPYHGMENAVVFHGTQGVIVYRAGKATLCQPDYTAISTFEGQQASHYAAFLAAIRDNSVDQSLVALKEAIASSDLCHFGNISHRVGEQKDDTEILARLKALGVPDFVFERFAALRENIEAAGNGTEKLVLGELLHLQAGEMPLRDASGAAQALLTAEDRAPFCLPSADAV